MTFSQFALTTKLLRNDREYCHAPEPRSNACQLCIYGSIRPLHYQAFRSLFQRFPIQVISPSEFALDLWCEKFPMNPSKVRVAPHAKLELCEDLKRFNKTGATEGGRFVGYPVITLRVGKAWLESYESLW